jgi:hypothetical protein
MNQNNHLLALDIAYQFEGLRTENSYINHEGKVGVPPEELLGMVLHEEEGWCLHI